jgi:CRP-like cAMP-binding protein
VESGRPYSRLLSRLQRSTALWPEDKQRIAELPLTVTNFSSNQEIVRQGCPTSRCTLVLAGFLYSHKLAMGSRRQITSFLIPGDLPDLHTLYLSNLDHSLSALGPAVVAFLPHSPLRDMLDKSPRLADVFWRETFVEAAIFREWVSNLGRRDAVARVAHVVCELTMRLQAVELARNLRFSIPWTQTDLADACGISTVHANRVVQELRRRGLLECNSKEVRIRDWDALAKVADFSDAYLQLPIKQTLPPLRDKVPEHV